MGANSRVAALGWLAAAVMAGLGVLAPAAPAVASSLAGPRVQAFNPRAGAAGSKVTITGSGFTGARAVRFGGVAARFVVRSSSRITATVPAMPSAAGRITVSTRSGTAASRARFTVTPAVVLSPVTGPAGSVVKVSGTGFGALEGVDVFVGTADRALAGTGRVGSFGPVSVTIPATEAPGTAGISAEGRRSRLFAQAAFTVNANWAQFRGSGAHTGSNPFENVLSPSNVARLGQDWSRDTGNAVLSSPAVDDGVVYVGSDSSNVYALNAATDLRRWRFHSTKDAVFVSSPAVADGAVYIGTNLGQVLALNAATGAPRWTFRARAAVLASPTVASGVVYVGSEDDFMYALNAATGSKRWSIHVGPVQSSPAVANGVVYVGSDEGNVWAVNAATGAKLWTFPTGSAVFSSPAVANGVVYVGSNDGNVYALNAATGAELWNFSTQSGDGFFSSPAVAGGDVYVGSYDGNVYALNDATGTPLWTFTTGESVLSSPAVANGVVYIGSNDGNVYALDAATGARLWSFTTGSFVRSSPAVANGIVYIGSADGNLYAFGLPRPACRTTAGADPARSSLNTGGLTAATGQRRCSGGAADNSKVPTPLSPQQQRVNAAVPRR